MKYIFGNWKMNMLPNEALKYIEQLAEKLKFLKQESIENLSIKLFVPYINIFYTKLMSQETNIKIGAQNMYYEENGAFTGEVSGEMLKSVDIHTVLIGHSERRQIFNETDEIINKKLIKTQEIGLEAIFCIGETLEENEQGRTKEVLERQIIKGLENVNINNIIIAYEPVWAIGTGKVCDASNADDICKYIKDLIKVKYEKDLPVIYGGSVKNDNSKEILNKENIDGVLVGGASLNVEDFFEIITSGI